MAKLPNNICSDNLYKVRVSNRLSMPIYVIAKNFDEAIIIAKKVNFSKLLNNNIQIELVNKVYSYKEETEND